MSILFCGLLQIIKNTLVFERQRSALVRFGLHQLSTFGDAANQLELFFVQQDGATKITKLNLDINGLTMVYNKYSYS